MNTQERKSEDHQPERQPASEIKRDKKGVVVKLSVPNSELKKIDRSIEAALTLLLFFFCLVSR